MDQRGRLEISSWLSQGIATQGQGSSAVGALVIPSAIAVYELVVRPVHPRGMSRDLVAGENSGADSESDEEEIHVPHTARPGAPGSPDPRHQGVQPTAMTGWVGWVAFAGVMMALLGTFHVIQGLIAIFNDEYFLVTRSGLAVSLDFTVWGWVHVIGGLVVLAAGFGVFAAQVWARIVGVAVAMLSALVNVGFLAAFPIWSSIMILVDILVIWALTVHGGELRSEPESREY